MRKDNSKLYTIWANMKQRCNNYKAQRYHRYGGRGIRVCYAWESFYGFKIWAEKNGYKEGLSIDRKDNDGDYKPGNVRFIPKRKNSRHHKPGRTAQTKEYIHEKNRLAYYNRVGGML